MIKVHTAQFARSLTAFMKKSAVHLAPIIFTVLLLFVWCGVIYKRSAEKAAATAVTTARGEIVSIIRSAASEELVKTDLSETSRISYASDGTIAAIAADTSLINSAANAVLHAVKERCEKLDFLYVELPIGTLVGGDYLSGRGIKLKFRSEPYFSFSTEVESKLSDAGIDQVLYEITLTVNADVTLICMGRSESFSVSADFPIVKEVIRGTLSYGGVIVGRERQVIAKPPFTPIISPVINDAESDESQYTLSATSDASPFLPRGVSAARAESVSSPRELVISVMMTPGQTQLTLIPDGPTSLASAFVMPISAALEAEYMTSHAAPTCPHIDETNITDPDLFENISGSTSLVNRYADRTLLSITRSYSLSSVS